ncbi:hypothetical protein EON65_36180 [archaeon]|nr:MAG: hypothetical protein EON65_36180 [archaeon]
MIAEPLLQLEVLVVTRLGWPSWTLRLIAGLSVLVTITGLLEQILESRKLNKDSKSSKTKSGKHVHGSQRNKGFRWLQFHYLSVYLITMLADWLQGTNMYTLYSVSFHHHKLTKNKFIYLFLCYRACLNVVVWSGCGYIVLNRISI